MKRTKGQRGPDHQPRTRAKGSYKPPTDLVRTYTVQLTEVQNAAILDKWGSRTVAIKSLLL